jgi:hypothetical protein
MSIRIKVGVHIHSRHTHSTHTHKFIEPFHERVNMEYCVDFCVDFEKIWGKSWALAPEEIKLNED